MRIYWSHIHTPNHLPVSAGARLGRSNHMEAKIFISFLFLLHPSFNAVLQTTCADLNELEKIAADIDEHLV